MKSYRLRKPLPGLGEGAILTEFIDSYGRRWYHDEFDRFRFSAEIVEENYDWFEEIRQSK